ncbi:MAG: hypothetical protein IPO74_10885 [Thermomonas sp.]|nr:hypothetical protein [Thermomonas sp.]
MASTSYAPAVQSPRAATTASPVRAIEELGSNQGNAGDLGLGGSLLSPVTELLGDVWDWLMGNDGDEQTGQQASDQEPVCRTSDGQTPPDIAEVSGISATDVRAIYANNPRAQAALSTR